MNKDEIKKALERCCNSDFKTACRNCPYLTRPRCNDTLCKDALNLITEQEKEIERLKAENVRLTTKLGQVLLSIDTVKEMNTMCNIAAQVKQAKTDVLNELKKKIHDTRLNDDTAEIIIEMIEEVQNAEDKS